MSLSQWGLLYINNPRKDFKWWLFFSPFLIDVYTGNLHKGCSKLLFRHIFVTKTIGFPLTPSFFCIGFPTLCQKTLFFCEKDVCFKNMVSASQTQVSSDQNPRWLGSIGDYSTQLYRDYYKDPYQPTVFHGSCHVCGFWSLLNGATVNHPCVALRLGYLLKRLKGEADEERQQATKREMLQV